MDRQARQWREHVEKLSTSQVFALMDFPLRAGLSEAHVFIDKSLSMQLPESEIFDQLTYDYEDQSIFRKEQSCVAICVLHQRALDAAIKEKCRAFLSGIEDGKLSLLNQAECAFLRVMRKLSMLSRDRARRDRIENWLKVDPELERLAEPLLVSGFDRETELALHNLKFTELRSLTQVQLQKELDGILKTEEAMDGELAGPDRPLPGSQRPIGDFEYYGVNGQHDAFERIIRSFGIELKGVSSARPASGSE